jgi:hypothetical protein
MSCLPGSAQNLSILPGYNMPKHGILFPHFGYFKGGFFGKIRFVFPPGRLKQRFLLVRSLEAINFGPGIYSFWGDKFRVNDLLVDDMIISFLKILRSNTLKLINNLNYID